MFIHKPRPLDPVGGQETPEAVYLNRRRLLTTAGFVAGGAATAGVSYWAWRAYRGSDQQVVARGVAEGVPFAGYFPAQRDVRFEYGRAETFEPDAARYTNFYEFSPAKSSWKLVDGFRVAPWRVTVDGLCRHRLQLDLDDLLRRYARHLTERQYRHRCVETWAMAIPWTGIPLRLLLRDADPLPAATHVRFVTFNRPSEAPGIEGMPDLPWPYTEGLTLAEAGNELALLATGMYGHPLLKQHGAPLRLVVPWKYGYKSIKSIVRIELVDHQPDTFWSTLAPQAYPFESNVEPDIPRPWPQHSEWMLGSGEMHPTEPYNGYGEYVANLYDA